MVLACYRLQKKFLYALVDLEVLVKSGANTLCRQISCRVIHVTEILLWCRRKVMCTTVSYFLPRGSSSFSWQLWLGDCIHFAFICTNVIVSNLSRDNILFSTFYTGLFLLFRKKTGGGTGPPGPSPCYGTGLSTAISTAVSTDISVDITHSKQDPNILSD